MWYDHPTRTWAPSDQMIGGMWRSDWFYGKAEYCVLYRTKPHYIIIPKLYPRGSSGVAWLLPMNFELLFAWSYPQQAPPLLSRVIHLKTILHNYYRCGKSVLLTSPLFCCLLFQIIRIFERRRLLTMCRMSLPREIWGESMFGLYLTAVCQVGLRIALILTSRPGLQIGYPEDTN